MWSADKAPQWWTRIPRFRRRDALKVAVFRVWRRVVRYKFIEIPEDCGLMLRVEEWSIHGWPSRKEQAELLPDYTASHPIAVTNLKSNENFLLIASFRSEFRKQKKNQRLRHDFSVCPTFEARLQCLPYVWGTTSVSALRLRHDFSICPTFEAWLQCRSYVWGTTSVSVLPLRHNFNVCPTFEARLQCLSYVWDMYSVSVLRLRHVFSVCPTFETWLQCLSYVWDMYSVSVLRLRHVFSVSYVWGMYSVSALRLRHDFSVCPIGISWCLYHRHLPMLFAEVIVYWEYAL
jgi:hypothetical protein